MRCIRCGQELYASKTTEAMELENGLLVIRNIPCFKCEECGEIHFSGDVVQQIERITNEVEKHLQEVMPLKQSIQLHHFCLYLCSNIQLLLFPEVQLDYTLHTSQELM